MKFCCNRLVIRSLWIYLHYFYCTVLYTGSFLHTVIYKQYLSYYWDGCTVLHKSNFTVEWEYLSFAYSFLVISENNATNHILPRVRFSGLHFCCRQRWSIGPKAAEFSEIMQNNGNNTVQGHSRSSISVPMKSIYVNNSNLPPTLHHFQHTVNYWSNFCYQQGWWPLFSTLSRGKPLNSGLQN